MNRKNADILNAEYENVHIVCPHCDKKVIFNRVTDLNEGIPPDYIDGTEVNCQDCNGNVWIYGDCINPVYDKLFYESIDLCKNKQYRFVVINLCTASELFFYYCIRVNLLLLPYKNRILNIDQLNELSEQTHDKLKHCAYVDIRNIFLNAYIKEANYSRYADISSDCTNILNTKNEPSDNSIQNLRNPKLKNYFVKLKEWEICRLRNDVAHKIAFRPNRNETEKTIKEYEDIIFNLKTILNVKDWNFYINNRI